MHIGGCGCGGCVSDDYDVSLYLAVSLTHSNYLLFYIRLRMCV